MSRRVPTTIEKIYDENFVHILSNVGKFRITHVAVFPTETRIFEFQFKIHTSYNLVGN